MNDQQFHPMETEERDDAKNPNEARPELEKAYSECLILLREEKFQDAVACLKSIVAEHPDFATAYNDLGVLYYRLADKKQSLQNYERAVSIDPSNLNFRKNLADFYFVEQGRMNKAMEIYLSVLKDDPEDIDVLLVAGHICSAMDKKKSARTFYERVLDIEPWNFEAGDCLENL